MNTKCAARLLRDTAYKLLRSRAGQALAEYMLLLALIVVGCVLAVSAIGDDLIPRFENTTEQFNNASSNDAEQEGVDGGDGEED